MTYKIIKDAPPPDAARAGRPPVYPFAGMEVGDAFDVARTGWGKDGRDRSQRNLRTCATSWAKRNGQTAKFQVRVLDEHTIRCWRIA